ncbi:Mss4-like protein [Mycena rebaudengoi]|nr:Mss4-like protein [Mycena rebaudengoi]
MSDSVLAEYRGNCHCGAFKFKFKTADLKQTACDCSICSKNAYMWAHPDSESFTVLKGDENVTLVGYEFGKKMLTHKFCPTCGTSVMARFHQETHGMTVLINLRAVQGLDFASVPSGETYKGSASGSPYQPPEPVPTGPIPEGSTQYNGSCHCGAVAYTVLNPEKITSACECDCSICWRDGALWIYPATANISFRGLESVSEYTFAKKRTYHGFCKVCGVAIYERFIGQRKDGTERGLVQALNIRTMNDLDLSTVEIEKGDGSSGEPQYVVPE